MQLFIRPGNGSAKDDVGGGLNPVTMPSRPMSCGCNGTASLSVLMMFTRAKRAACRLQNQMTSQASATAGGQGAFGQGAGTSSGLAVSHSALIWPSANL